MPQVERPKEVNDAIDRLLREGTVEELKSEKGKFLRLFMTPDEVDRSMDLSMGEAKGFDGSTCDLCRGEYRFKQCGRCAGSFDNLPACDPTMVAARAEVAAAAKKNAGPVAKFFGGIFQGINVDFRLRGRE